MQYILQHRTPEDALRPAANALAPLLVHSGAAFLQLCQKLLASHPETSDALKHQAMQHAQALVQMQHGHGDMASSKKIREQLTSLVTELVGVLHQM